MFLLKIKNKKRTNGINFCLFFLDIKALLDVVAPLTTLAVVLRYPLEKGDP